MIPRTLRTCVVLLALSGCAAPAQRVTSVNEGRAAFRDARALAADDAGRLYIVDAATSSVHVLDESGTELATIGGSGTADEGLFTPVDVDPTNGLAIFIADRDGGTIQRYTREFRAVEVVAVPDLDAATTDAGGRRGLRPTSVLAGAGGVLYVADAARGAVVLINARREVERVISPNGATTIVRPVGLALESSTGNLMVGDGETGTIRIFDPFGTPLRSVQTTGIGDLIGISNAGDRRTLAVGTLGLALMDDFGLPRPVRRWTAAEPLVDAELVGRQLWLLTSRQLQHIEMPSEYFNSLPIQDRPRRR